MGKHELITRARAAFDTMNAADPNLIQTPGGSRPRELVMAERLTEWIARLAPSASIPLRLAGGCQHLRRWAISRTDYPDGRVGYLQWRTALGRFHAEEAGRVLREVGFDDATIEAVQRLNRKKDLKRSPDAQTLEDALCLVFLEHQIDGFAAARDDAKMIDIIAKTWRKMSPAGHAEALALSYSPRIQGLIDEALGTRGHP